MGLEYLVRTSKFTEKQMKGANVASPCNYGETQCVNGELWRCMEFLPNKYVWVNTGQRC
jgi:hypothetical protein